MANPFRDIPENWVEESGYEYVRKCLRPLFGAFIVALFIWVFQSVFLGLLAAAFFVHMPQFSKSSSGIKMINMIWVGALLIVILFLAWSNNPILGIGLEGLGTSSIVFLGVWLISVAGGLSSDNKTRPIVGIIIIAVSFFIFTAGVGGQAVGAAFFGEWWPAVHNFFGTIWDPISSAFGGIADMFSRAFLMITDPVGAAHQIIDGTWATNDWGPTGAWGLSIQEFKVGRGGTQDIYVEQPFNLILKVKNIGASDAENVVAGVAIDNERLGISDISITDFGVTEPVSNIGIMKKKAMTQLNLNGVVSCSFVEEHDLREKFLPFVGNVSYDYTVDSLLGIEFISGEEWDRLAENSDWTTQQVRSEVTSSPVMLSISTFDQPILAGNAFFVGFSLKSKKDDSSIERAKVMIDYPEDFGDSNCGGLAEAKDGKITWEPMIIEKVEEYIMYCDFHKSSMDLGGTATKTYHVMANAEYRLVEWKSYDSKLSFASGVCGEEIKLCCFKKQPDSECAAQYNDIKGIKYSGMGFGDSDFCSKKAGLLGVDSTHENAKCKMGEGGCQSSSECDQAEMSPKSEWEAPLECRPVKV